MRKFLKFTPAILWMIMIFYISSQPVIPSNKIYVVDFFIKKNAHVIEYFILTLLWVFALGRKKLTTAALIALAYAFTDEIHQLFVPGRTGYLRDVGIDALGIGLASFLIINYDLWKKYITRNQSKKLSK